MGLEDLVGKAVGRLGKKITQLEAIEEALRIGTIVDTIYSKNVKPEKLPDLYKETIADYIHGFEEGIGSHWIGKSGEVIFESEFIKRKESMKFPNVYQLGFNYGQGLMETAEKHKNFGIKRAMATAQTVSRELYQIFESTIKGMSYQQEQK